MSNQGVKMTSTPPGFSVSDEQQKIATLAYELWLARAFRGGSPAEDWLRAEIQVRGKAAATIRRAMEGIFLVS